MRNDQPKSLNDMGDMMAACLATGEQAWSGLATKPASEDVRTVGITLFLEAMRRGLPMPDHARFLRRCDELRRELGDDAYRFTLLADFGLSLPTEVRPDDTETMRAVIDSLEEALASSQMAASTH